jgi:hypothetical protein
METLTCHPLFYLENKMWNLYIITLFGAMAITDVNEVPVQYTLEDCVELVNLIADEVNLQAECRRGKND